MKNITISLFTLIVIVLNTYAASPSGTTLSDERQFGRMLKERARQDSEFAFEIFRQITATDREPNVFISPLSISTVLSMTCNGASGNTKTEMESALNMRGFSKDEINDYYRFMLNTLPGIDPKTKLNIANSICKR